ncbi:hypothetical protein BDV39DRAFT_199354 [Aspergillus sergii]|uniref:deuterolysin n=1 Tax=Aspergillus sergii TaxID=1034303 RepID=A0A5N6XJR4_9EURO|nr:hypothetical protein BDV39DRAFT_199354 [Aspergillus sergii]
MAAKAAASIRANNVTSLFQTFFKTTLNIHNHVTGILEEIAQEATQQGSGLVTYSCQPDSITCQSGSSTQTGYASTDGYRAQVSTFPAYFQLPQVSDDCSVLDQRTSTLHELCHTKGILGYEVYAYSNVLGLDSQTAPKNAESYAFFSKSVYLGCNGQFVSSGSSWGSLGGTGSTGNTGNSGSSWWNPFTNFGF